MDLFENQYIQIGIIAIAGLIIMLLRSFLMKESPLKSVIRPLRLRIIGATTGFVVGMFILYLTNQLYITLIVIFTVQFLADLLLHYVKKND